MGNLAFAGITNTGALRRSLTNILRSGQTLFSMIVARIAERLAAADPSRQFEAVFAEGTVSFIYRYHTGI